MFDPVILKRFETPDEVREMPLGRFEIVRLAGIAVGRATYRPGWKWSVHVGPTVGGDRCMVEHVGLVLAGTATPPSQTEPSSSSAREISSISPPHHTTAGWWETSHTFPSTFWERSTMRSRARGPGVQ